MARQRFQSQTEMWGLQNRLPALGAAFKSEPQQEASGSCSLCLSAQAGDANVPPLRLENAP